MAEDVVLDDEEACAAAEAAVIGAVVGVRVAPFTFVVR
jgi:hypothetical protein